MGYVLDAELAPAMAALAAQAAQARAPARGDWPALRERLHRTGPAYIEVGDLDIFRDEAIAYAGGLASAGVPIELHVHPGAPHGFERFVPDAAVARRAMADRTRAIIAI
ncbi:MAG TPA: alpha/beta hydrolase fold domain-containing protein [Streptosporangiaceae bacterium]|nr:alpha/beta hydrolase fold domain-containing protein [Streptosporangiaceae bacterium]